MLCIDFPASLEGTLVAIYQACSRPSFKSSMFRAETLDVGVSPPNFNLASPRHQG